MTLKFTILGCGSSIGVPKPDGSFGNCDPKNIKITEQDVVLLFQQNMETHL